ncbi:MAG: class 1 isoprenoid biosynthesis enzyme [Bryobacteraceae bacterium]
MERGSTNLSSKVIASASEIPEDTSLDALRAVLTSLSSQGNNLRVADVTDQVFSALFYSHLWPVLTKTWPPAGAGACLVWTIRNIPFRKFKSAVPVLLTASHPRSIGPALAAELMFALFYLLDDLIDQRTHRYGKETALGASGPAQSATAIMVALTQIDEWLASMQASDSVRRAVNEGARALADEQIKRRGTGALNLDDYAEHSIRRTRFLGDLWTIACEESGCDAEASLIQRIYGTCALAGQVKNDLRDIRTMEKEERFRDVRDGVRTSCVLRLLEVAGKPEREWLSARLAAGGSVTIEDEAELSRLFSEHDIDAWASSQVRALSEQILATIDAADVCEAKRLVLSEWVALQFTSGLGSISDHSPVRVRQFLKAVADLTERLSTCAPG